MSDNTKSTAQLEMESAREFVLHHVRSLVLGPVGKSDERLGCAPNDLYLSGVLYPKRDVMGSAEDDGALPAGDLSESDAVAPPRESYKPSSIGVTFTVRNGVEFKVSSGTSARYLKVDDASSQASWQRTPLNVSQVILAGSSRGHAVFHDAKLRLFVVERTHGDFTTYTLSLVNDALPSDFNDYSSALVFQSQILIECETASFHSRQAIQAGGSDEASLNDMLFRKSREFAVGHGVSVVWGDVTGDVVSKIWTEWMPVQKVESTSADGHDSLNQFKNNHPGAFSADWLSRSPKEEVIRALEGFLSCYEGWIVSTGARVNGDARGHEDTANAQLSVCRKALARMRAGVSCLSASDIAWESFRAANRAMDDQSKYVSKGPSARPMVWRPFQLGFLLLSIDSIVDPGSPSREEMDLLWFPTGGGKTEAYLFLAAFTIFRKRLVSPVRRQQGGVDVLMRYTLRLLTVQQYQRAAAVMLACDQIRLSDVNKWGAAPISAGLLVGGDTTPNSIRDADEALNSASPKSTPRILQSCPCCGKVFAKNDFILSIENKTLHARCTNSGCLVSSTMGIPSLTVDDIVFEHPPSLLLGTVDKFAQLPRNKNIGQVLRKGGVPPDLIIQDELHLISGPLGSIAGLYEVLIDKLCSIDLIRPKVVGSSATVGGATRQVRALFDREVMQFPPSGIDAEDSFFAVKDPVSPDRLYVGLCNAGRSPKFALQFIQAAVMQSALLAKERTPVNLPAIDPYWSMLIYYNTIRELGAGLTMSSDDVPRTMRTFAKHMNSGVCPPRVLKVVPMELSSNVKSSEIPLRIRQLGRPLGGPPLEPPVDVVLASNIISVGLDIPRLGVMIMNQQPKTVSEYIQATSRVGRGIPGLVFTLHNVMRPRDASYFEHFKYMHSTLYKGVEANSVTPWASRARDKCIAPVFAALVRYLIPGMADDDNAIGFESLSDEVLNPIIGLVVERASSSGRHDMGNAEAVSQLRAELLSFCSKWRSMSRAASSGGFKFFYWRTSPVTKSALLRSAEDAVIYLTETPAPNSMRDVEPSTSYYLNQP